MKKAIIIPSSFKGSLSSMQVGTIMEESIHRVFPDCETIKIPISDGGEGCVDCFISAFGGHRVEVQTLDPYRQKNITSFYGLLDNGTAVIEMAASAGLPLVADCPNPGLTSTYGVGQLIKNAIANGARSLVIGLGGSCTNDAGVGLAAAIGVRFFDKEKHEFIPTGFTLGKICDITLDKLMPEARNTRIMVLCDVKNTFMGPNGAAYVFAPQKGANPQQVRQLDDNLKEFSIFLKARFGFDTDFEGAGAAGGTSVSLKLFFAAEIKRGIDTILGFIDFDKMLIGCDAVFTGEGKLDVTSFQGKVIDGLAAYAKRHDVPLYAFVGQVKEVAPKDYPEGLSEVFSLKEKNADLATAIRDTPDNLAKKVTLLCQKIKAK